MSLGLILNIEILFFKKYYLIINKEKGIQKATGYNLWLLHVVLILAIAVEDGVFNKYVVYFADCL